MNDFEEKLNNTFREKMKKYEDELKSIKSDYEKNQEKLKQEIFQALSEKQENINEKNKIEKEKQNVEVNSTQSIKKAVILLLLIILLSLFVYFKFIRNNKIDVPPPQTTEDFIILG